MLGVLAALLLAGCGESLLDRDAFASGADVGHAGDSGSTLDSAAPIDGAGDSDTKKPECETKHDCLGKTPCNILTCVGWQVRDHVVEGR